MQEYIRELGRLLVLQGDACCNYAEVTARLQQITIESSQLMSIVKSLNVKVYKAVLQGRLDEEHHGGQTGLTNAQYQFVLVSKVDFDI